MKVLWKIKVIDLSILNVDTSRRLIFSITPKPFYFWQDKTR